MKTIFVLEVNSPQEVRDEIVEEIDRRLKPLLRAQERRMNQMATVKNSSQIQVLRELQDFLADLDIRIKETNE